ncbi:MAG TPA: response regulator [Candidatus Megaira endosymbiont of Nemacystus decipiens]|nr:response regulator [Candidatus Megaera endosymbiont of Nemacystus decipiens]
MSKVLIVEDNELNMKLFRDLLTIKKHDVIVSKDGIGVLDIAESKKPDLILMDIQLNGISGLNLIEGLKKNSATKDIPIIAISAFAMKQDEITISSSGCDLYLAKPVAIADFFQAIDRFLR